MAAAAGTGCGRLVLSSRCSFIGTRQGRVLAKTPRAWAGARARAQISSTVPAAETTAVDNRRACNCLSTLACPICYEPLESEESSLTSLECKSCKKAYSSNEAYCDLTITSSSKDFAETKPTMTELFRSPFVSNLYERGWRQSFMLAGFPGAEKEFEMAKEYLQPTFGGTIIDASCGSGLFSRMFSGSGLYNCVIALDFSENMLKQCSEFAKQEGISRENLVIVRADIARLPFESSSIDAVHAGAALHCWPSPSTALAEISRVLRPGGSFVATTFTAAGSLFSAFPFSLSLELLSNLYGTYIAMSEGEIEDLFKACGFVNFTCMRDRFFIMMSATKPF